MCHPALSVGDLLISIIFNAIFFLSRFLSNSPLGNHVGLTDPLEKLTHAQCSVVIVQF